MASTFIDGLPRIESQHLPDGSRCMICFNVYGTTTEDGAAEDAVRLPCGHDVGADCIYRWLSADGEAKNSCPACRSVFFRAHPRPYTEHGGGVWAGGDGDGDSREHAAAAREEWRGVVRGLVRIDLVAIFLDVIGDEGQPWRDDGLDVQTIEQGGGGRGSQDVRNFVRTRWPQFLGTTPEQYQRSIRNARAIIATPDGPNGEASVEIRRPHPMIPGSSQSVLVGLEDVDPQDVEDLIQDLATAFRTLSFREALAYSVLKFFRDASQVPFYLPLENVRPLNAEREEELFLAMEVRGAFASGDFDGHFTNRERWQMHRMCGEAWNPTTRRWSWDWSL